MRVRGAPAIAIAGALSLAVEAHALVEGGHTLSNPSAAADYLSDKLDYLTTSRPTAVNLSEAATRLSAFVRSQVSLLPATAEGASQLLGCYIEEAERFVIEWEGDAFNLLFLVVTQDARCRYLRQQSTGKPWCNIYTTTHQ